MISEIQKLTSVLLVVIPFQWEGLQDLYQEDVEGDGHQML